MSQQRVQQLCDILQPDELARSIANEFVELDMLRQTRKQSWEEIRRYVYATDTTMTSNSALPWKNKTTIPKLCQIRDNLYANYTATMLQQRNWLEWEPENEESNDRFKVEAITNYMNWVIVQPSFKSEVYKTILDYIDFGNAFVTVDWLDDRVISEERYQTGYVGPVAKRISPLDLVMNPTGSVFTKTPKIIRSLISIGEVKEMLETIAQGDNAQEYEELWDYLKNIRGQATSFEGEWHDNDALYNIDGFTSYRDYLRSGYAEILTFYGDLYDPENDVFLKNHVITVVDRHKLIGKKPNPTFFGYPPIFHSPWRKKQDNLWGMGPLDNLVGMQYRLDHVENMKADIFDLTTYPVQMVTGFVEDYTWQPGEKIFVGEDGKVELVTPDVNALQANFEIQNLERLMEEMAGAPREAMGFRTPGEKTKYEVQRLENAAYRLFQNKIRQFEEEILEPLMNAMLEMARRHLTGALTIPVFDDEFKATSFATLTPDDITGVGRIKPVGSRHFAEQAELVQNLSSLTSSGMWPVIQPHFSGIKLAKIFEQSFNLERYGVVLPWVALSEQSDAQRQMNVLEENVAANTTTATGMGEDFDVDQTIPAEAPMPTNEEV